MTKSILFLSGALLLAVSHGAYAKDPCIANCDGGGVSSATVTMQQLQNQTQRQQQNAVGVGIGVGGAGGSSAAVAAGGGGGQGGAGGAGGSGGNATGGNANVRTTATGGNAVAIGGGGGNAYNAGQSNNQSTFFQSPNPAPSMVAVPPGLTGAIGFGVCATQDSHSDGFGVGVGAAVPSAGLNFSHGNTNTSENLQCDYGRTVQAICQVNPNFRVKGHHTAGQVCAHVMAKLAGVQDALNELDQEDAQAAKQANVARSSTGWGHCDHDGKCYDGAGKRTN